MEQAIQQAVDAWWKREAEGFPGEKIPENEAVARTIELAKAMDIPANEIIARGKEKGFVAQPPPAEQKQGEPVAEKMEKKGGTAMEATETMSSVIRANLTKSNDEIAEILKAKGISFVKNSISAIRSQSKAKRKLARKAKKQAAQQPPPPPKAAAPKTPPAPVPKAPKVPTAQETVDKLILGLEEKIASLELQLQEARNNLESCKTTRALM